METQQSHYFKFACICMLIAIISVTMAYGYSTHQSHNVYAVITSLSPTNTNGEDSSLILSSRVSTLAGSSTPGSNNGTGTTASISSPYEVAYDGTGNLYVADRKNI